MPILTVGVYTELEYASLNWNVLINKTLSENDNTQSQNDLFAKIKKYCQDKPERSLHMHLAMAQMGLFSYAGLKNQTNDLNKLKNNLLKFIQLLANDQPQIIQYADSEKITLIDLAFYYVLDDLVLWLLQKGAPQKPDRSDRNIVDRDSWRQSISSDPFKIGNEKIDLNVRLRTMDQNFAEYIIQLKDYVKFMAELLSITEQTKTANPITLLAGKPQLVYRVVDYLDLKPILKPPIQMRQVQPLLDTYHEPPREQVTPNWFDNYLEPYHEPHFSDRYRPQFPGQQVTPPQFIPQFNMQSLGWLPAASSSTQGDEFLRRISLLQIEDQPPLTQAKPATPSLYR